MDYWVHSTRKDPGNLRVEPRTNWSPGTASTSSYGGGGATATAKLVLYGEKEEEEEGGDVH